MTEGKTDTPAQRKPLRLWPGVIAAILLFLVKFIVPRFMPDALPVALKVL
ncbi:MAG: hypothetical protein ACYC3W_12605 [Candidatus Nanopelagicales bacterium]